MATIKLQGNASGSGSVILTAPDTNATRTITLPDTDTVLIGGAPVVGTLNGTGTIALQNDTGVSSVADNGTGKYQFNFSSNFSTATYYASGSVSYHSSSHWSYLANHFSGGNQDNTRTTSQCKVSSYDSGYVDTPSVGLMASE
jgi:hypothetical protein